MSNQITDREWEQLSAYLDNQLPQRDRDQFEKKLADQLSLQQALDDLKRTRVLLASAPRRRAPRNFTLTPSMVRPRLEKRLIPFFSWASATTLVMFILSFFIRLLPLASPVGLMSAPDTSTKPMQEVYRAQEASPSDKSQPVPAAPGITWGTPPPGMPRPQMGGGMAPPPGMGGGEDSAPKSTSLPPVQPAAVQSPTPSPSLKIAPTEKVLPSPGDHRPTEGGIKKVESGAGPVLGIPTENAGKIIATPPVSVEREPISGKSTNVNDLVVAQVGLVIASVLFGVAAILLRLRINRE